METRSLEDRVMQSLARVRTEAGGPDVVDAGVVRSVTAGPDGEVRIGIALQPGVPRDIADTIRLVATGVIGVVRATVELADPASGPPEGSVPVQAAPAGTSGKGGRRPLPVMAPPGGERTSPQRRPPRRSWAAQRQPKRPRASSPYPERTDSLAGV